MTYRIAYDVDRDNPNPHPWVLGSMQFESYEEAQKTVEEEERELEVEGYSPEEMMPWLIVSDGS